ncbi:MAG: tRNA epoxyqueuosine(34) reductase QueG, partial [Saprospiraceae bacterium]
MLDKKHITTSLKKKALEMGFMGIAIAKAEHMKQEAVNLEKWLNKGFHGEMSYMENHFDKRVDPTKLVLGSKSVISLMYNYYSETKISEEGESKIAMYAYGKDYHKVVKKKLKHLYRWMEDQFGKIEGRFFVDSAPVMEREWAKRSGLGWIGKHTLLVNPKKGSYFFLCEIICDLDLEYDHAIKDHCGTCTRCIEACPTDAISPNGYLMDGSKCISFLTIESKNSIPEEYKGKMDNWMFGCDICQQVCPWNRFSIPHNEEKFVPNPKLVSMKKKDWEELTEEVFDSIFEGSPIKRTKYSG